MKRIMIIRHGEKPAGVGPDHGVTCNGVHDSHDLTVRGWQRAGALVPYFAWADARPGSPVSTPRAIFASAATRASPSRRAQHSVTALAAMLRLRVDCSHADGEEPALAAAVLTAPSPTLIAWHHSHIVRLVGLIAGDVAGAPRHWPDDRFDLVWCLDRAGPNAGWRFTQVAQRLLPHDAETVPDPALRIVS